MRGPTQGSPEESSRRSARVRWGSRNGSRALALLALAVWAGGEAGAAAELELQSAVFRAKPGVVMIGVEVGATAAIRCGAGEAQTVRPVPLSWVGSGFIIHPDGWVVTNGHVVQPLYEKDEATLARQLLERALAQACRPALEVLVGENRARRLRALMADPANRRGVTLEKKLQVGLGNGVTYPAEVKVYSPPAFVEVGTRKDAAGAIHREYGKDVAILKIAARDLPVVRLARHSTNLRLGQVVFVIGFPGVVLGHELLSRSTRFEPSITVGHISGFKDDIAGHRVIQTDSAIIQGNSGGPVFDHRGNVIGAATFTSLLGEQVVQGFNFLIPVETVHEAAKQAGVVPRPESEFTSLWNAAAGLYIRGRLYRSMRKLQAANKIHPGFPDVERVTEDCAIESAEQPYLHREEVQWGLMGVGIMGGVAGVWFGGRRAAGAGALWVREIIRGEVENILASRR